MSYLHKSYNRSRIETNQGWVYVYASQRETALLCNDVSHWLGANLESVLKMPSAKSIEVKNRAVSPLGQNVELEF